MGGADEQNMNNMVCLCRRGSSGARSFLLFWRSVQGELRLVRPVELLVLPRANQLLERVKARDAALARELALSRLLVACLRVAGTGRHLIAEATRQADLEGETLSAEWRSTLADDLAREQREDWQRAAAGQVSAEDALAEQFWQAHADLPVLPETFDDPELGRFSRALYAHLVEPGEGLIEISMPRRELAGLWRSGFKELGLAIRPRRLKKLWRRRLAVAIRHVGQMTGQLAKELIRDSLRAAQEAAEKGLGKDLGPPEFTADEESLVELYYGACRELGDLSVAFLGGCGEELARRLDAYAKAIVEGTPQQRIAAAEQLRRYAWLRVQFLEARKVIRAERRRAARERRAHRLPGRRQQAQGKPDPKAAPPDRKLQAVEELERLRSLLPSLKGRDAERVEALLASRGDYSQAAARLGLSTGTFRRRWRETTQPNIARAWRKHCDEEPS